ncbi:MAG TPA: VWA domain-containing protein [Terracidiphilus sp.]|nr:VWA domain-containing protein [Terracidiphilus sp.]
MLCAPLCLRAQQSVPTDHDRARAVVLAVTARDRKGDLVANLQASDLTLTLDGRSQSIGTLTRQSDLPFEVGLLVDTSRSMMSSMESIRKGADKFVDAMLPASSGAAKNEVFLIHFDREVELLQDFTGSRDKLYKQVEEMGPTSRSRDEREGPETMDNPRERPGDSRLGTQLYDAIYLASDEMMKPKNGRKSLVVVTDGVDYGSKMSLNDAVDAAEQADVTVYAIYLKGEQGREAGLPGLNGGRPGASGDRTVDGRHILEQIATRTGGRYFDTRRKSDLEQIYALIATELQGQYLLTFTPDRLDDDGAFHKISLKANQADVTVMTREGLFAPGGSEK